MEEDAGAGAVSAHGGATSVSYIVEGSHFLLKITQCHQHHEVKLHVMDFEGSCRLEDAAA